MKIKYLIIVCLFPVLFLGQTVQKFKKNADGVNITLSNGTLKISALAENAVRIRFYKDEESKLPELIFTSHKSDAEFKIVDSPSIIELKNKKIIIDVDKQTGKLSFADNTGKIF